MAKIKVDNTEITVVNLHDEDYISLNCTKFDTIRNINVVLINDGMPQGERLVKLNQIAIQQMQVFYDTYQPLDTFLI